jgi:type III pantothenate kinase
VTAARRRAATGPLVTVDVGNTDTVVGRFNGPDLDESWRVTSSRTTTDELRLQLEQMLRTGAAGCPSVLCSVVPHQTRAWAEALHAITGRDPIEVSARTSPIKLQVTEPDSVGPDRIANALAGKVLHGSPCIVIDLGTATTFDCVNRTGHSSVAPSHRGSRPPRANCSGARRGSPTSSCVVPSAPSAARPRRTCVSVCCGGTRDWSTRSCAACATSSAAVPKVIATGGLARMVAAECETVDLVDEGLTLKGLQLFWEAVR